MSVKRTKRNRAQSSNGIFSVECERKRGCGVKHKSRDHPYILLLFNLLAIVFFARCGAAKLDAKIMFDAVLLSILVGRRFGGGHLMTDQFKALGISFVCVGSFLPSSQNLYLIHINKVIYVMSLF